MAYFYDNDPTIGITVTGPMGSGGGGGGDSNTGGDIMPYFIPVGEVYIVRRFRQGLFSEVIDIEGVLDLDGVLVEVS